jgi:uncharacterized protein (DUF58 family)
VRSALGRWRAEWGGRVAAWIRRRQGDDRLPVELGLRRVYILPTRAGAGFSGMVLAMLAAGLNYANSLALLLSFVLAGFLIVAMNLCHRNLNGLRVIAAGADPVFSGERPRVALTVASPGSLARHAVRLDAPDGTQTSGTVPAAGTHRLDLSMHPLERGVHPLDRLRISTDFPFGLFRAWSWLHLPLEVVCYPAPLGARRPPAAPEARETGMRPTDSGREEWRGLRPFRDGDSPRQVAWKAYARGLPLLVKEYGGTAADALELDYGSLDGIDAESRLRQLSRWVLDAEAEGGRYGLRLPGRRLELGRGATHRAACLDALARVDVRCAH